MGVSWGTDRLEYVRKEGGIIRVRPCQEIKHLLSQARFPPGFLPATQHHSKHCYLLTKTLEWGPRGQKGKMKITPVPMNQFFPGALFFKLWSLEEQQHHLGVF